MLFTVLSTEGIGVVCASAVVGGAPVNVQCAVLFEYLCLVVWLRT
jgi:hypothetical protein